MSAGLGAPAAVTKGISALMVGSSAKGNAYNYALQQGYTKEQAETYSTLTGVSEAALQYALSGIRKLGGGLTGNIAEKAIRNINSAVLRVAVEMPILMGGEFSEELLQAALEPVIRNIAFDENNKFRLFTPENLYQGLIGALTVLPFELGPTIARNVKYEQLGHGVNEARKADDLIARALEMDPKTEAHKLARKLADGIIHKNEYNIGELLMAYAQAGGDMAFMKAPRAEMQGTETALSEQPEPGSYGVRVMLPDQIGQSVKESIQNNVQAQPYVVQKALVEGMSTLIGIETRLRAESRNINYNGFNVESSQTAYIDYQTAKGTTKAAHLGIAAEAMAADIRAAFATGQLTEAEAGRLQGVLSEIVGDASLAQSYVDEEYLLTQESMAKIDSERGVGDNEIAKYINKMSTTPEEYYASALEVGKRSDLTVEQKVRLLQAMYYALGDGNRKDVRCPADARFVKGFDKKGVPIYDWPKYWGFVLSSIKPLRRGKLNLPRLWSRIGSMHGNSFSDIPENGVSYTNSQRSLPDIENPEAEHRGTSRQDEYYFDVIDAIAARDLDGLNKLLNMNGLESISDVEMDLLFNDYTDYIRGTEEIFKGVKERVDRDMNVKYGLFGIAAPWIKDGEVLLSGGATQYTLPLSIQQLIELGVLKN